MRGTNCFLLPSSIYPVFVQFTLIFSLCVSPALHYVASLLNNTTTLFYNLYSTTRRTNSQIFFLLLLAATERTTTILRIPATLLIKALLSIVCP